MVIGTPKEIKKEEYRVALTPDGAWELKRDGIDIHTHRELKAPAWF